MIVKEVPDNRELIFPTNSIWINFFNTWNKFDHNKCKIWSSEQCQFCIFYYYKNDCIIRPFYALLLSLAVNQNWWLNRFFSVRKISLNFCVWWTIFFWSNYITKNRCHHKFIKSFQFFKICHQQITWNIFPNRIFT